MRHFLCLFMITICLTTKGCSCRKEDSSDVPKPTPEESSKEPDTSASKESRVDNDQSSEQKTASDSPDEAPNVATKSTNSGVEESAASGGPPKGVVPGEPSDSTQAGRGGNFGGVEPGQEVEGNRKFSSVEAARTYAELKRDLAHEAASDGDYRQAFTHSKVAWQSLREFPQNERAQSLSSKLLDEMERYGERIDQNGDESIDTKLKVQ